MDEELQFFCSMRLAEHIWYGKGYLLLNDFLSKFDQNFIKILHKSFNIFDVLILIEM